MKQATTAIIATILSVIFAFGALVICEICYRAFWYEAPRGQQIDVTVFPYKPYLVSSQPAGLELGNSKNILEGYFGHGECDAAGGVTARFNSEGFRSPEFPGSTSKSENTIRIAITGGSSSVSWGIGESCTLDNVLQTRLSARFPDKKIEVYNIGSGGWKSLQELISVQMHIGRIVPDIIVQFSGFNDAYHATVMPINHAYTQVLVNTAFELRKSEVLGTTRGFFGKFLLAHKVKDLFKAPQYSLSESANTGSQEFPTLAVDPGPHKVRTKFEAPLDLEAIAARTDFDPYNRHVVDNYVYHTTLISKAAEMIGAKVITVLQPTLYMKEPLGEGEQRVFSSGHAPYVNFTVQAYLRIMDELNKRKNENDNFEFVDMSRAFNGMPVDFFGDNVHFNARGYKIVGEQLADVIAHSLSNKQ